MLVQEDALFTTSIVELMGGGVTSQLKAYALEIFSPGGLGSTFSFSLPLSAV
jgi:hypothetical protein